MSRMEGRRIGKLVSWVLGVSIAVALALPLPSLALPGQSLPQFKAWEQRQKLLADLARTTDEMSGFPAFQLTTSDHGVAWRYYAMTDGKTIRRETVSVGQVRKPPGTEQIRHDGRGYGFTFLSALYGRAIAGDFRSARLIASVIDSTNGHVTHYYLGHRYGYAEAGGLTLETFNALKADVALAQRCAKSPQRCAE